MAWTQRSGAETDGPETTQKDGESCAEMEPDDGLAPLVSVQTEFDDRELKLP